MLKERLFQIENLGNLGNINKTFFYIITYVVHSNNLKQPGADIAM